MQADILKRLRDWFKKNAAALPWRPLNLDAPRAPYAVWISETMLQQTQVSTVRDYFVRWMERFPDVETLAKASEKEVFKYWQGLGYYSRARNILKTATIIAKASGNFPQTRKELEALPGIGAYTAGAILSLAFHKKEAILDGNLVRIFSRFYAIAFLPGDKKTSRTDDGKNNSAEIYWNYAREVADNPKAYMHNEALMELGRTVCKSKSPLCGSCPLAGGCRAYRENRVEEFPPKRAHVQKVWHGTALVIERADGKILAVTAGQAFLRGQLALPHFETPKNATTGIPLQAERYIDADSVISVKDCGSFRHSITVHKIECKVLYVLLSSKAKKIQADCTWIKKSAAKDTFANSFSLKALKLALV